MTSVSNENRQERVRKACETFVKIELENDPSGHDWWHIDRVVKVAERLAYAEEADVFVCVIAALLHDVADEKLNESKESGLRKVGDWLASQPIEVEESEHVMEIISNMSYNAGTNP